MGIPHLITHLRPYAEVKSLRGKGIIIDGPALAYHIYHLCLTLRPRAKNPFEASPTYEELGEAVILWLDFLESHQLTIKQIFFDGFLPSSKKEVRISRLDAYTRQLSIYSNTLQHTLPCSKKLLPLSLTKENLFRGGKIATAATRIPAATFQVAAIIEALFASEKYGSVVQVVPDEADSFCADYVKANGGVILTGDSDLLVHDLGPSGSVVFLRDLDMSQQRSDLETQDLTCLQYQPQAIAIRLGLSASDGLRNLAFAISQDHYLSFPQLLQRSKDATYIPSHQELYKTFLQDYYQPTTTPTSLPKTDTTKLLQTLHPRLSEFILQFPHFSTLAWSPFNLLPPSAHTNNLSKSTTKEIFLPFILDHPLRTSAWEVSTHIRLTAYSLPNLIIPPTPTSTSQIDGHYTKCVIERRRQENGSRGREWMLPTLEEMAETVRDLIDVFKRLRVALPGMGGGDIWRAYSVHLDFEYSKSWERTALSESEYHRHSSITANDRKELHWETIHHIAQMQATYYSLRILQQMLGLVLSVPVTNTNGKESLLSLLGVLKEELADLPTLSGLAGFEEEWVRIGSSEMGGVLGVVRGMLGVVEEKGESKEEKEENKRKRVDGGGGVLDGEGGGKKSSNPFEALMME